MGRVFSLKLKVDLGIIPDWGIKGAYLCVEGLGKNSTITYGPI